MRFGCYGGAFKSSADDQAAARAAGPAAKSTLTMVPWPTTLSIVTPPP